MGVLRHVDTGALRALDVENVVGRSPRAALQLAAPYVSSQHASLNWRNATWEVRDLGSRNGTLVGEALLNAGQAHKLQRGERTTFGRKGETWELMDDAPPQPCLLPADGHSEPVCIDGHLLALPSSNEPQATLLCTPDGAWALEQSDSSLTLVTGQEFEVGARKWRFFCPSFTSQTSTVDWPDLVGLRGARLLFRVSQDEEHVEISATRGREAVALGAREHNYLLLLLARRRLADAAENQREGLHGWIYQDELLTALRLSPEQLNLDVFRIRKQFAAVGGKGGVNIIERRPRTKEIRIGWSDLVIERI